jgi:hypothetical protein
MRQKYLHYPLQSWTEKSGDDSSSKFIDKEVLSQFLARSLGGDIDEELTLTCDSCSFFGCSLFRIEGWFLFSCSTPISNY